jgi:hypothetical protein
MQSQCIDNITIVPTYVVNVVRGDCRYDGRRSVMDQKGKTFVRTVILMIIIT